LTGKFAGKIMDVHYTNQISNCLKAAFLLSLVGVCFVLARSAFAASHTEIYSAITFDLTVTLPLAYLFFIRKTKITKLSTIGFFIFGIVFASFILPTENQKPLDYLKLFALPALEFGFLTYAGFIVFKSRKTYKSLDRNRRDFLENLRAALVKEFPSERAANALAFEIAGFYYAFFRWKTKRAANFYTYHKKNGAAFLLAAIAFLVAAETFVLHVLIADLSLMTAWILTAFSAYFLFQIFAHGKAIFLRPTEIAENKIFIRCGLLGDAVIDLKNVESVDFAAPLEKPHKQDVILSPLGKFTACNLKLSLKNQATLRGIYGKRKNFTTIFFTADEAENLKAEIEKNIIKENEI
jgi:hypothetical protein